MNFEGFFELAKTRRSIRHFTDCKPDRRQIDRLIETACWAPSNHNRQGWKFIVFEDSELIRKLAERIRQSLKKTLAEAHWLVAQRGEELFRSCGAFEQAPVAILAMHKKAPVVGGKLLSSATSELASGEALSTAMGVQNLLLGAHAMGLGACVMTAPLLSGEAWSSLRHLPNGFEPTCVIALGYPGERPDAPRRKDIRHVVEYR